MRTTDVNITMQHPLVRSYLHDLDTALRDVDTNEADEIRSAIREHLATEFSMRADASNLSIDETVSEVLEDLGPVEAITGELIANGEDTVAEKKKRNLLTAGVLTAISIAISPYALPISVILSVVSVVFLVRSTPGRLRIALIIINNVIFFGLLAMAIIGFAIHGEFGQSVTIG